MFDTPSFSSLRMQKSCSTSTMQDSKRVKQVRSESHLNGYTNRQFDKKLPKKQSKVMIHGNASPAEVFHRNLVDAVSNAEDSDDNEHYVYPYSSNENLGATHAMHRPVSVRSSQNEIKKSFITHHSGTGLGDWLKQALYHQPRLPYDTMDEEDEFGWSGNEQAGDMRRPRLRNHVKDPTIQVHRPSLFDLWRESFNRKHAGKKYTPRTYYHSQHHHQEGYTSDDEEAPLIQRRQKRLKTKKTWKSWYRVFLYQTLLFLLFLLVLFYQAQPLAELSVDIGRVLATDKELIFDLRVQASNSNFWTVHIADADISVFAFSQIVPNQITNQTVIQGVDPAEYLGNVRRFDEPLSIKPKKSDINKEEAITQIRIKSPGADTSGNERWSRMIRYPYGLVVRGVLKYQPVPFAIGVYPQSVAVCNVTHVDPTTGIISTDPDRTICANEDQVNLVFL
ncbi:hypothetical protein A0J61_07727 [Choanephora cucurbitarum]|uniref:Uncharacterized protein n=1 Tax=Choanephora cucurbitarum TaxID=101091 RepID=A0A1C7N5C3_9FUNG|nr:hypothetical protein A0J61_07727 [Choanephora cucurbitarum]